MTLKVGDVVFLKSGSPPLLVEQAEESDDKVWVCWLGKNDEILRGRFPRQGAIRGEFRLTEPTGFTIRAFCELISEELGTV